MKRKGVSSVGKDHNFVPLALRHCVLLKIEGIDADLLHRPLIAITACFGVRTPISKQPAPMGTNFISASTSLTPHHTSAAHTVAAKSATAGGAAATMLQKRDRRPRAARHKAPMNSRIAACHSLLGTLRCRLASALISLAPTAKPSPPTKYSIDHK